MSAPPLPYHCATAAPQQKTGPKTTHITTACKAAISPFPFKQFIKRYIMIYVVTQHILLKNNLIYPFDLFVIYPLDLFPRCGHGFGLDHLS